MIMFNGFALNNIKNAYVGSTPAQAIYIGSTLIWPTTPSEHDYSKDYFTIVSLEDNNVIYFGVKNAAYSKTISVSTDNGNTWTDYTSSEPLNDSFVFGTSIASLNTGEKILIKGNNTNYCNNVLDERNNYFSSEKRFNVEGNIMSLIYGDNFIGQNILPNESYIFARLFDQVSATNLHKNTIVSAENLILPTTLRTGCYYGMFYLCTLLTTAPVLPATTLVTACYENMFNGCSSLNYVKCLSTETESGSHDQTNNWLRGVSSSGTFVKDANTTWPSGESGIPSGWTIQNA